jgi:hypothetical protein
MVLYCRIARRALISIERHEHTFAEPRRGSTTAIYTAKDVQALTGLESDKEAKFSIDIDSLREIAMRSDSSSPVDVDMQILMDYLPQQHNFNYSH